MFIIVLPDTIFDKPFEKKATCHEISYLTTIIIAMPPRQRLSQLDRLFRVFDMRCNSVLIKLLVC